MYTLNNLVILILLLILIIICFYSYEKFMNTTCSIREQSNNEIFRRYRLAEQSNICYENINNNFSSMNLNIR